MYALFFSFHSRDGGGNDNVKHVYEFYKIKNIYQETMGQKWSSMLAVSPTFLCI